MIHRQGAKEKKELLVICDWLLGKRMKKPVLHVAGASCSRPSMERPAPCFEQPKHLLLFSSFFCLEVFCLLQNRNAEAREAQRKWGGSR